MDTPPWVDPALLDEEEQYSGGRCRRCGCPLLASEGAHCGGKNPDGLNCSAHVARDVLAATGGVQTWEHFHRTRPDRMWSG